MRLFRLAIEEQRWDLAAHTIVLAAARLLNEVACPRNRQTGEKRNAPRGRDKLQCHEKQAKS